MKVTLLKRFIAAVLAFCISGCVAIPKPQPVDPTITPIILDQEQLGHFNILDDVLFPSGTYLPEFQTKDGVFYRAPQAMLFSLGSISNAKRLAKMNIVQYGADLGDVYKRTGGLLVPSPQSKAQTVGVWMDAYGLIRPTVPYYCRRSDNITFRRAPLP